MRYKWWFVKYCVIYNINDCSFQPMMALLRPLPDGERRYIFNWAHWAVGTVATILACKFLSRKYLLLSPTKRGSCQAACICVILSECNNT